MSYGYETRTARAYVKGGMPVQVEGTYEWDDSVGECGVEDITVRWANTGKPVTDRFAESLSAADWDAIAEAIAEGD